jgi:hypothetical protein
MPSPAPVAPSIPRSIPPPNLDGKLGEYILRDTLLYDSLGWEELVRHRRGKGDIRVDPRLQHPAKPLLAHLGTKGAPCVLSDRPWSKARLLEAMTRGPHKSALDFTDFLEEEFADFVDRCQWIVLPWSRAKNLKNLRVSPPGVVPQRERRPRFIADLTFWMINMMTVNLSPKEAMQFGRALDRLVHQIVLANPAHGPVRQMKVDLADGFYRMWLQLRDIPKLALVLPPLAGSTEPLIALPLGLPMGWVESPPWFCVATETVADVANMRLLRPLSTVPPHRLESAANTPPPASPAAPAIPAAETTPLTAVPAPTGVDPLLTRMQSRSRILASYDIYVDDYLGLVQGDKHRRSQVRRVLLHAIDQVFRPLEPGDFPGRKEPTSVKKLLKGDAYWETRKVMLGWILDSFLMTLELPPHRRLRLQELLASIPRSQRRCSVRTWHKLLGELRSMSVALPGSRGLFSQLQLALKESSQGRLRLDRGVHDAIADFTWISENLSSRPTRLYELVELPPVGHGATDSCKHCMGGVMFACRDLPVPPTLWRFNFPKDIVNQLVTSKNRSGNVTIADLELSATVVQQEGYTTLVDTRERTTHTCADNTNTVSWQRRGSVSTNSACAYLLRVQALHQRFHRYHPTHSYIPGPFNVMADDVSRLYDLSDSQLLAYFNLTYPQKLPWRMWHPPPAMLSSVTSSLRRTRCAPESFLAVPELLLATGNAGLISATKCKSTRIYERKIRTSTLYPSSKYSLRDTAPALLRPAVKPCELALWKTPSVQWRKRWPLWGPRIRV